MITPRSAQGRLVAGVVGAALVATAGLAVRTASAQPSPGDQPTDTAAQAVAYDAKTIYRGVFFGHGPVAHLIPRYVQNHAPETAATRATEDAIMAEVDRRSPGAVREFADAVASGSHVATRAALLRNSELVQQVVKERYGVELTDEKQAGRAVIAAIPVAVAVVVVVWKYVKKYSSSPDGTASKLEMDALVHDLVTKI